MHIIRRFLIKLLTGNDTVILNAEFINGTIYATRGMIANNVFKLGDYPEPAHTFTIGNVAIVDDVR